MNEDEGSVERLVRTERVGLEVLEEWNNATTCTGGKGYLFHLHRFHGGDGREKSLEEKRMRVFSCAYRRRQC